MQLAKWRAEKQWTQARLAAVLGCNISSVHRYESGHRIPEPATMALIFTVTGGAVEPNDFYELPALPVPQRDAA